MSDGMIVVVVWSAVALHLIVAVLTWRGHRTVTLVPWVNLAVGVAVLVYWVQEWYGYLTRGIQWYVTDQLVPLYAIVIVLLSVAALAGRAPSTTPHRVILGIDGLVLLGFALFFSFLKFDRMI